MIATRERPVGARPVKPPSGFWHQPVWMNLVSGSLILLASAMFGVAAFKLAVKLPLFGLREVVVVSPMAHVTLAQLQYVADSSLHGNFFTVDLEKARKAFENLPWVRSAQLRRRWPGTIEVILEEHVALAYWRSVDSGDTRLVNNFGELFDAAANDSMPVFSGPPEAAGMMLGQMRHFNELLQPMQRKIVALSLSGRHAWQIRLDDGMLLELGKDRAEQGSRSLDDRLVRFVALWPQTREKFGKPVSMADLRYQSGFAVRLADSEQRKGKQ